MLTKRLRIQKKSNEEYFKRSRLSTNQRDPVVEVHFQTTAWAANIVGILPAMRWTRLRKAKKVSPANYCNHKASSIKASTRQKTEQQNL